MSRIFGRDQKQWIDEGTPRWYIKSKIDKSPKRMKILEQAYHIVREVQMEDDNGNIENVYMGLGIRDRQKVDTLSKYIWIDDSIDDNDDLPEAAKTILNKYSNP
jgi:hypothetical protein